MKTKLVATILAWVVFLGGMSGMILSETHAQAEHQHKTRDLRHFAAHIVDVKNGEIFFTDLESEPGVVMVQHAFVDKSFRMLKMSENKSGDGTFEIISLGALQNAKGVLTTCVGCGRALGLRVGNVDFYK